MTTWHPADDFDRIDAELRASHLMTDERANRIEQPERPATGPDWSEAAQYNATSQPQVEISYFTDVDENTVAVFATWEWVTENEKTLPSGDEERIYYFALLTRERSMPTHMRLLHSLRKQKMENKTPTRCYSNLGFRLNAVDWCHTCGK